MATYVAEAIEIILDAGLGVPPAYTNSAIGLMSDGHIVLITDRPTLTSVSGDTTRTDWVKGILTRDYGNWTLSRSIDFVEAGGFETVSGFTVGIKNTADFRNTLQSNGVYLGRRRVKYYRFTSTNGTAWTAELRWTGVIDDQPFNERTFTLQCVDASKDIFKSLPVQPVNRSTFTDSPDDSQDKMIPIALGRVAYSPLVNVSGSGAKTTLCVVDTVEYAIAAARDYVYTVPSIGANLYLYTPGILFTENDSRLVGKFLKVASGGTAQYTRITSNIQTSELGFGEDNTVLFLDEPLSSSPVLFTDLSNRSKAIWYFEVVDLGGVFSASTREIQSIIRSGQGRPMLHIYDGDLKTYADISEFNFASSSENINHIGYPGYSLASKSASDNGDPACYFPILPVSIKAVSGSLFTMPVVDGDDMPDLKDLDDATEYAYTGSNNFGTIKVDVYLSAEETFKSLSGLYPLLSFAHGYASGSNSTQISLTVTAFDIYGREADLYDSAVGIFNDFVGTGTNAVSLLPRLYYGEEGEYDSDTDFRAYRQDLDLSTTFQDSQTALVFKRLRFTLSFTKASGVNYTFRLREVGFVGKRDLNLDSQPVYGSLKGENYGNTMDGRVTATDYSQTVVRGLEYLIRNYDEGAPAWEGTRTYLAGDYVRGSADTGHVFVCTVAGTSSASEPAWTDTVGATYTDGSVTWKEHHEIPIDTASFDTAESSLLYWKIGRTLTEKKASIEYYKSLLSQSFLLAVMTPAGKIQLKAWLQNFTPVIAFSESNIIQSTLGNVVLTPVRRMSNDLRVKYDKNPGSGKFNKQIAVTNIDKPAFPGPLETVSAGISLGSFSATYEYIPIGTGLYSVTFETSLPHSLNSGDYASLSGNVHGYNFASAQVGVTDSTHFVVILTSGGFTASPTTSGSLSKLTTTRLKWKDYVVGIDNYATAEAIWSQCHNSYLVTKTINPLPDELGECEWYFDSYAQDGNGKYIWSDDGGETVAAELNLGDTHSAVLFTELLANWTAWQKKQVTFETADNATFSAIGLGDCVTFTDSKLTSGSTLTGWVHEKTQLPRDERRMERFRWGITLYPEALSTYVPPGIIEEHGATDIIDERGGTDIIEEHGA